LGRRRILNGAPTTDDNLVQAQNIPVAENVVLVHGLYADGSSWIDVISYLQRAGLNVIAVQNPLTSLADAVAATRRALASQEGPTVLVGHSFAGTIINEAGNDPNVSAQLYVAARAPDAGEGNAEQIDAINRGYRNNRFHLWFTSA
jgi:pimeloyl-ACP methyl ester carboxylesterase